MIVNILLAMGSLLIVAGLALVAYQVIYPPQAPPAASPVHTPTLSASSPYPGIILVAFGVILLLATRLF